MLPSLGICIVVRNEAPYIEEWLAFHLIQGASRIIVYDNGSTDGTLQLLWRASVNAPIDVVDWSEQSGHFDSVQRAAYMDGVFRLIGLTDFVAFIDVDEFLHVGVGQTVAEALAVFSSEVSAIAVNQRVFGSSYQIDYEATPVTTRFIRCTEPEYAENCWCKTIARPERIVGFSSVHSVVLGSGSYVMNDGATFTQDTKHPGLANRIGIGRLTVNHYMLRSLGEYHRKQQRWEIRLEMRERYDMTYFHGREPTANAVVDDRLVSYSDQLEHMLSQLRTPPDRV